MFDFIIKKGSTSIILPVSLYDSSSTTGAKLAGLVYNSSGLSAYYNRMGASGAATAIMLATATKGTWATGGFVAIDATNMPGDYELHIPDAALVTGANMVLIQIKGATNLVPKNILIKLVDNEEIDSYTILNHADHGLAQLVRSTTPANKLVISSAGDVGITQTGADKVWSTASRTLSGFGTLIADIWAYATRRLTDATNITSDGATIDQTKIARLDANVSSRSSHTAADIWAVGTRTLTSFGSLVADLWAYATRTITGGTITTNSDKSGYSLTTPPPTAVQIRQELDSNSTKLNDIQATVIAIYGYLDTEVAAILAVALKLDTMLEADGMLWRWTVASLINASSSGVTPAEIADAVWDELISDHSTLGSAGYFLNAAGASGDPWAILLPGDYAEGTAGHILGQSIYEGYRGIGE
jgi:hypothetical protein